MPVLTQPATQAAAATTTWQIDSAHTQVEFAVRHLMISTVRGRFSDVSGTLTAPGARFALGQLEATINAASLDTREPQRDAHLRSADFFDVEKFPTITFKSRRIEAEPVDPDTFTVTGDLTIHGVTKEIRLDVTAEGRGRDPWGNDRAGFSATGRISRKDFGLVWNQLLETGGVAVGDEVKISIDTELIAKPAEAAA
jgi:polyisoprenoid-binding protein YceI